MCTEVDLHFVLPKRGIVTRTGTPDLTDLYTITKGPVMKQNRQLLLLALLSFFCLPLFSAGVSQSPPAGIKVLTYNICWECMTGKNAMGRHCPLVAGHATQTVCTTNIADMLKNADSHYEGIDFIALQEASRFTELDVLIPSMMPKFKKTHHKSGPEDQVTFYNHAKYNLEKEIVSEFSSGRPYQILIFKEKIIFVNLHNPHLDPKKNPASYMEEKLSEGLTQKLTSAEIKSLQGFRIILAGDFNDSDNLLRVLTPFKGAGISTQVSLKVVNPPKTCCSHTLSTGHSGTYDYVLDSNAAVPLLFEVPKGYDPTTPKSDHLPVMAVLPI